MTTTRPRMRAPTATPTYGPHRAMRPPSVPSVSVWLRDFDESHFDSRNGPETDQRLSPGRWIGAAASDAGLVASTVRFVVHRTRSFARVCSREGLD